MTNESILCIHCGVDIEESADHVPPKGFFPKPRPSDLFTVPACNRCNHSSSKDEEYIVALLNFGPAGVTEAGKALWEQKLHRMYARPEAKGFRKLIAESFSILQLETPSGLYVGDAMGIAVDMVRVERVIAKIVRGLYYVEYGEALPISAGILVEFLRGENDFHRFGLGKGDFGVMPGRRTWPGVFEYGFNRVTQEPFNSIWALRFYGESYAFACTAEQAHRDTNVQELCDDASSEFDPLT